MIPASFDRVVAAQELTDDPTLIGWLRSQLSGVSGQAVRRLIEEGKVFVGDAPEVRPTRKLKGGLKISLQHAAKRVDRSHRFELKLHHLDPQLVVAEKPVGILTIPFEDDRDTLADRVRTIIPRIEKRGPIHPLRAVHRLDREASGLVVFARTTPTQRLLQDQFAAHTVERVYLALVHGDVAFRERCTVRSVLVADRGDGLKGSAASPDAFGKEAITHLEVLERLGAATLLRVRLETGRTHQIRIHCAELGHPIVGEPVYMRDYRGQRLDAPRLMLHATVLGFIHPATKQALRFESPAPEPMTRLIQALKRG